MARTRRDDASGVVQHVMVQGIERRLIFLDDRDRDELLRRLSVLLPELGFRCFGWVLMPNHAHLIVRSAESRISRLMARLGTGYARYFNLRHERVGHLFRNRFLSRRVVDDADLIGLVLYVCRNPLEAGLATPAALEEYPWCGVGALMGRRAAHPFESVRETLALFDPDPSRARDRLRGWLAMPLEPAPPPRWPDAEAAPSAPASDRSTSLPTLIAEACAKLSVSRDELSFPLRRNARIAAARALVAARASRELGLAGAEIARTLGVTPSAVSRMLARAERSRPPERVN